MEAAKRRSSKQRAIDARTERIEAEVRTRHPEFDELTYSWFAGDLFVHVWAAGKNVAGYIDIVDDLETALTNPGGSR